jgi:hypothetical protein
LSGSHGSQIGTASFFLLRNILSNTLAIMERRLMGLYDGTSVGGFPGLDNDDLIELPLNRKVANA